jgi:hypothetical protein
MRKWRWSSMDNYENSILGKTYIARDLMPSILTWLEAL